MQKEFIEQRIIEIVSRWLVRNSAAERGVIDIGLSDMAVAATQEIMAIVGDVVEQNEHALAAAGLSNNHAPDCERV